MRHNRRLQSTAFVLALLGASIAGADDFLGDGQIHVDVSPRQDHIYAVATDGDALYLAGSDGVPGPSRWRVEKRSLADGALVPEFGDGGVLSIDPTSDFDRVTALALDGRHLFLIGEGAARLRIEKRIAFDGRLRTTFADGGVFELPDERAVWQSPNSARVVKDHLYVATSGGRVLKLRTRDGVELKRFRPAQLPGAPMLVTAIAASGGALYFGAATSDGFRFEKRGRPEGRLLASSDVAFAHVGCGTEAPQAIVVADRTLIIGGMVSGAWHLERRRQRDLARLWSVDLPGTGSCDVVNDLVVVGDELIAVGSRNRQHRVEKRRLADGALVPEFGSGGVVVTAFPITGATAAAPACGDVVVASSATVAGSNEAWHAERYDATSGRRVVTSRATCATPGPR